MPYPRNHMLLHWVFNMPGGEQGSGSMRFDDPTRLVGDLGIENIDTDEGMMEVYNDLKAKWTTAAFGIPAYVTLQGCKWNQIDTAGHYAKQETRYYDEGGSPVPGGLTGLTPMPNQVALATTWRTNVTRGLANRGRTFWPRHRALGTDGRLDQGAAQTFANQDAELIESWGNWPGFDITGFAPCIMSNLGAGASRYVRAAEVGRVFDTMRSRRGALVEDRQRAEIDAPN